MGLLQSCRDDRSTYQTSSSSFPCSSFFLSIISTRNLEIRAPTLRMHYEGTVDFEGRVRALKEKLSAQDDLVRVAYAKYELAKARLVKKNNVRGADEIDLADFEMQVDDYVERARDAQADVAAAEKDRCVLIDATRSVDRVADDIWAVVNARLDPTHAPISFEDLHA